MVEKILIPIKCCECKGDLIEKSVKLSCDCILGWCEDCAKKQIAAELGNRKRLTEESCLYCPICKSPSIIKFALEETRYTTSEKYNFRHPLLSDVKFKRNYFLEKCIKCYLRNESDILSLCGVCNVCFAEGNSVKTVCCAENICQLCIRSQVARSSRTYWSGSISCVYCRKDIQLLSTSKAQDSETKFIRKLWKFLFPNKRLTVKTFTLPCLKVMWFGVVYFHDHELDKFQELWNYFKLGRGDSKRNINFDRVKARIVGIKGDLNSKVVEADIKDIDQENPCIDMLRCELVRLYLWRTEKARLKPWGPLAKLKFPRDRLLERWVLMRKEDMRNAAGQLDISQSDLGYYEVVEVNEALEIKTSIPEVQIMLNQSDVIQKKIQERENAILNAPVNASQSGDTKVKRTTADVARFVRQLSLEEELDEIADPEPESYDLVSESPSKDSISDDDVDNEIEAEDSSIIDLSEEPMAVIATRDTEPVQEVLQSPSLPLPPPAASPTVPAQRQREAPDTAPSQTPQRLLPVNREVNIPPHAIALPPQPSAPLQQQKHARNSPAQLAQSSISSPTVRSGPVQPHTPSVPKSPARPAQSTKKKRTAATGLPTLPSNTAAPIQTTSPPSTAVPPAPLIVQPPAVPKPKRTLVETITQNRGLKTLKRPTTKMIEFEAPSSKRPTTSSQSAPQNITPNTNQESAANYPPPGPSTSLNTANNVLNPSAPVVMNSISSSVSLESSRESNDAVPTIAMVAAGDETVTEVEMTTPDTGSSITPADPLILRQTPCTGSILKSAEIDSSMFLDSSGAIPTTKKAKKCVTFKYDLCEYEPKRPQVNYIDDDITVVPGHDREEGEEDDEEDLIRRQVHHLAAIASEEMLENFEGENELIQAVLSTNQLESFLLRAIQDRKSDTAFNVRDKDAFYADCQDAFRQYEQSIQDRLADGSLAQGIEVSSNESKSNEELSLWRPLKRELSDNVVEVFRPIDFKTLGSFSLLVVTPPSWGVLKTDVAFIDENLRNETTSYPVVFTMPDFTLTSLGLKQQYTAKLTFKSIKLPLTALLTQLKVQLNFHGEINHVRSSVDESFFLKRNKSLAYYNIPPGSKIEVRPIVATRRRIFQRRRPNGPTAKEDALKVAQRMQIEALAANKGLPPTFKRGNDPYDDSSDNDSDSSEGSNGRSSNKKRGKQRKGLVKKDAPAAGSAQYQKSNHNNSSNNHHRYNNNFRNNNNNNNNHHNSSNSNSFRNNSNYNNKDDNTNNRNNNSNNNYISNSEHKDGHRGYYGKDRREDRRDR